MTYGEAVVLTFFAFLAAGLLLLAFLVSKLYEWGFPAPLWRAVDWAWFAAARVVDRVITALLLTVRARL